jgi:hypothetical protein
MNIDFTGLSAMFDFGGKLIDKIFPDKDAADKAKVAMLELHQRGELVELEARMKAITTEAGSTDPWTSRARPMFMYVIYILILSALPFSIFFAFRPDTAMQVVAGFKAWLEAIPADMLALFGFGYLGYAGGRTIEKIKGVSK